MNGRRKQLRLKGYDYSSHGVCSRACGPRPGSIGAIIGQYKSAVTKQIRLLENNSVYIWQRNYYEHIIRDKDDLNHIRQYIVNNPKQWDEDDNHPLQQDKEV